MPPLTSHSEPATLQAQLPRAGLVSQLDLEASILTNGIGNLGASQMPQRSILYDSTLATELEGNPVHLLSMKSLGTYNLTCEGTIARSPAHTPCCDQRQF